jgi:hypothetical protein
MLLLYIRKAGQAQAFRATPDLQDYAAAPAILCRWGWLSGGSFVIRTRRRMASAQLSHRICEKFKLHLHNSHFMIAPDRGFHPGAAAASGDSCPLPLVRSMQTQNVCEEFFDRRERIFAEG